MPCLYAPCVSLTRAVAPLAARWPARVVGPELERRVRRQLDTMQPRLLCDLAPTMCEKVARQVRRLGEAEG